MNLPITYNLPFKFIGDDTRRIFFHELAVNGAKHVVLGTGLLPQMMARPELPEIVAAELEAEGLSFVDSHAPYGLHWDIGDPFEKEWNTKILRLKLSIELAAFFNVRTMTLHSGKLSSGVTPEQRFINICRALDELLDFAEKCKVTLCLENGFAYLGFPQTLLDVKERYPVDTLGFCFDAGHANMRTAPDPARQNGNFCALDFLDAMLPHIVNCHIHDNDGMHDQHDLPGRGCADWNKIVALLKKAPRLQVLQSEVAIAGNTVAARELVETFERIFGEKS